MAKSAEKRGKDETKAAEKTVKATGKKAGGARGGITAPVTPSPDLAEIVGEKDRRASGGLGSHQRSGPA